MRYNDVFLEESHKFFNSTTQYFNRLEYVSKFQDIIYFLLLRPSSFNRYITHYSYFKSFRSDVSNVGPNVAMLAERGKLTDIGSWYLGDSDTRNFPCGDPSRIAGFASDGLLNTSMSIWFVVLVLQVIGV